MVHNEEYIQSRQKKKNNLDKVSWYGLVFILSMLICGSKINKLCVSFGVALVGASGCGVLGLVSLIGVCFGYVLFWEFQIAGGYIASAVFVYTIAFIFQYTKLYEQAFFMPLVVLTTVGITLMYGTISAARGMEQYVFHIAIELLLSCTFTHYFHLIIFRSEKYEESHLFSMILFASCIITVFLDEYIIDVLSVGRILAYWCLMLLSVSVSPALGVVLSAVMGLVLDLSGASLHFLFSNMLYSVIYYCLKPRHKWTSVILLSMVVLITSIYTDANRIQLDTLSVMISGLLFIFTPQYIAHQMFFCVDNELRHCVYENKDYILLDELLNDVQLCLQSSADYEELNDNKKICESVFDEVCKSCCKGDICRTNHKTKIYDLMSELETEIERCGSVSATYFPKWFLDYCCEKDIIFDRISAALKNRYENKMFMEEKYAQHVLLCDLFQTISNATQNAIKNVPSQSVSNLKLEKMLFQSLRDQGYHTELLVRGCPNEKLCIELVGGDAKRVIEDKKCMRRIADITDRKFRVLRDANNIHEIHLVESETYSVSVGVASKKKKGERVCGDQCSYFKTTDGVFYAILSDGLGTGEYAAAQSRKMIGQLERLIISGIAPEDAVHIVYTIFRLNNIDGLSCATVDLLSVDLYSGDALLYKLGSSPSYVIHNGEIRRNIAEGLPAGVTDAYERKILCLDQKLCAGDVIILMTDGVYIDESFSLEQMIGEEMGMKNLSRRILIESQKNEGMDDDMTVITIKLDYRT